VRAHAEDLAAAEREAVQERQQAEAELADTERRLRGILSAIESGAWNETLRARLDELEKRKADLTATIGRSVQAAPPAHLHPAAAEIYQAQVAELEAALNDPEIRTEASEALRGLIARVVLTPDEGAPDGLRAELYGDLAEILALPSGARSRREAGAERVHEKLPGTCVPGSQLSVVAGTRNLLDLLLAG